MNLDGLLSKGIIEEFKHSDLNQIRNEIGIAVNDISSSKRMLEIGEWGWAHNAAYNAMLQSGRALMLSRGYRPKAQGHHFAVVSFVRTVYSSKIPQDVLEAFDKARFRRNESLYDRAGTISESQARNLVVKADTFVTYACKILKISRESDHNGRIR